MKTINILGDTQREQWHSVVNMLRQLGGDLAYEGRSKLCDELDRYIDAMEDANGVENEPRKVFALVRYSYIEHETDGMVMLFSSAEDARAEMKQQYEKTIELCEIDPNNLRRDAVADWQSLNITDNSAWISDYPDDIYWRIEEKEVAV